jgi:predicted dehydrogenase
MTMSVATLESKSAPLLNAPVRRSLPARVALVGVGNRARIFLRALAVDHVQHSRLVALCDSNPLRLEQCNRQLIEEWNHSPVETFPADQFATMVARTRPDVIVVCTPDRLHPAYCVQAMECGCDVIVEKPVAIDAAGGQAILDAERRTGRRTRVTFNCRYMPWAVMLKRLLASGTIGEILSADCEWMLDARKGVTYFSRWHSEKANSGGLLIHKATHHFDLMNWWLDAVPRTVFAMGRRGFFGAENKQKHGIGPTGDYYLDHPEGDPFAPMPLLSESQRALCLDAARLDGYRPDRSVWRERNLDIEDSLSVQVRYSTGALFSYRLNAFLPRPGAHIIFNGTHGRIEIHQDPGGRVPTRQTDRIPPTPPEAEPVAWRSRCIIHPMFGQAYEMTIPAAQGNHEGSDPLLLAGLFGPDAPDPWHQCAGAEQGIASAAIGIAGNRSIETGQAVDISDIAPRMAGAVRLSDLQ